MSFIPFIFSLTSIFFVALFTETGGVLAADQNDGVYIVYMGAAASVKGQLKQEHAQLLASLSRRKKILVHNYKNGFSGFAAPLSEEEAHSIREKPGVVSVFPDPVLELHTTRSWDFLRYLTTREVESNSNSDTNSTSYVSDTIIGILDTGIWPEAESFNDKNMGPIPSRWNGTCVNAPDFNSSNCNKKLTGARSYGYNDVESVIKYHSPRDLLGHGTHVASTAAGSVVEGASFYGLANGTAKGGAPGARIAMYGICASDGCTGSNILAAFDDAIADGVDVLSLSLGSSSFFKQDIIEDPIALGAFHAVQRGITVVCSAGNSGPYPGSVVNAAPWILTVAASTTDRDFESDVVLGNDKLIIKGEGLHFANLSVSPVHPIIYAKSASISGANEDESSNCIPETLDEEIIKGKIVVCDNTDASYSMKDKKDEVKKLGAIGVILIDDESRPVVSNSGSFPMTVVSSKDRNKILSYINSTKNPQATIWATTSPINHKPAPAIAYFSSRGPSTVPINILKPDIAAPGVNIFAAWTGNDKVEGPNGKDPILYNIISGTSMSCPHVSGIAATVKSKNPKWSPSAVRSAIMTTATQMNNLDAPITTETGTAGTPYDFGAGEVSTTRSLNPGLVYETTIIGYLNFLCYYGYNITSIKAMAGSIPDGFACPKDSSTDLISDINYPSIAMTNFSAHAGRKVNRTLTNVAGDDETDYTATIDAPSGLDVKVVPETLQFTKNGEQLSYEVTFSAVNPLSKDVFGSITWSNGKYKVRSPFAISSKSD